MSQALLFIVIRGLEIQNKVEGNSNEFPPKSGALNEHMGRGVSSLYAHPLNRLSRPA